MSFRQVQHSASRPAGQIQRAAPSGLLLRACACGSKAGPSGTCAQCDQEQLAGMQPKLRISRPGDAFEREADRIAEAVAGGSRIDSAFSNPTGGNNVARQALDSEEEEEEEEAIQPKPASAPPAYQGLPNPAPGTHSRIQRLRRSGGSGLDSAARAFMETRFGHDFSGVRVHTGGEAEQTARAIGAKAFTVGRDVVFGRGTYAPHSAEGRKLLAHELVHVIQQRGASRTGPAVLQRQAGDAKARDPAAEKFCKYKSIEGARIDVNTAAFMAELWPEEYIPKLYRELKSARKCFPAFDEAAFLSAVSTTKIYSDAMRKQVARGYPRYVQKDDRRLIWRESKKPFAGYRVTGFDPEKRFLTAGRKKAYGYTPTESHKDYKEIVTHQWEKTGAAETGPDPRKKAQKSFSEADVLVFSGHQYAQYKAPGVFTDAYSKEVYDIRTLKPPLPNVKLLISTSCATICKDPAAIWKNTFPKAVFLGYKKSAPNNGAAVAKTFVKNLPNDLLFEAGGVSQAVDAWKKTILRRHSGDKKRNPGWHDVAANKVTYLYGKKFITVSADSQENKCKGKGDVSGDFPDPNLSAAQADAQEATP